MGTRLALTYAIIFMNGFVQEFIYSYRKPPAIWFRFIDDIWGPYKGSEEEMLEFFAHCNSVHESIKFTFECSKEKIVFLDVLTYREGNKLLVTLPTKPHDSQSYLEYGSCHPPLHEKKHSFCTIPYSKMELQHLI